jgi:hypothetical protein
VTYRLQVPAGRKGIANNEDKSYVSRMLRAPRNMYAHVDYAEPSPKTHADPSQRPFPGDFEPDQATRPPRVERNRDEVHLEGVKIWMRGRGVVS